MNQADQAHQQSRNAESLASLEFIQREIAAQPAKLKRELSIIQPLIPAGWSESMQRYECDPYENELTMRGLRGWWRMMK